MAPKKSSKYEIDPYYDTPEWRDLRRETLHRYKHICQYCGERAFQADHVIPRKKKGPDNLSNLVACCATCNQIAGNSLFVSFEAKKAWVRVQRGMQKPTKRPVKPRVAKNHRTATFGKTKRGSLRSKLAAKNNPELYQIETLLRNSQS